MLKNGGSGQLEVGRRALLEDLAGSTANTVRHEIVRICDQRVPYQVNNLIVPC